VFTSSWFCIATAIAHSNLPDLSIHQMNIRLVIHLTIHTLTISKNNWLQILPFPLPLLSSNDLLLGGLPGPWRHLELADEWNRYSSSKSYFSLPQACWLCTYSSAHHIQKQPSSKSYPSHHLLSLPVIYIPPCLFVSSASPTLPQVLAISENHHPHNLTYPIITSQASRRYPFVMSRKENMS